MSKLKVSIYGDSISSFEGYSNTIDKDNMVYYPLKGMVKHVNDTWWMRVIIDMGYELLINNSSSGCYVKGVGNCSLSTSDEGVGSRINHLNTEDTNPDLILVYMGINDLNHLKPSVEFKNDYEEMLLKLLDLYKTSKLVVLNFQKITDDDKAELRKEYNNSVNSLVDKYHLILADLENMKISGKDYINNSSDNLHPNVLGMSSIAITVEKALKQNLK